MQNNNNKKNVDNNKYIAPQTQNIKVLNVLFWNMPSYFNPNLFENLVSSAPIPSHKWYFKIEDLWFLFLDCEEEVNEQPDSFA